MAPRDGSANHSQRDVAGTFYHYRWSAPRKGLHRKRPRDQWVAIDVIPIVPREMWLRAQEVISANAVKTRKRKHVYLLFGMIRCGECGRAVYTNTTRSGPYYRCASALGMIAGQKKSERCRAPNINGATTRARRGLDERVWDAIAVRLKNPRLIAEEVRVELQVGASGASRDEMERELERKQQQLASLDRRRMSPWICAWRICCPRRNCGSGCRSWSGAAPRSATKSPGWRQA